MRTGTMTMKTTRRMAGFTMVELLIAIVIIGILVAIIVPVLSNRASEARIAAAKADMQTIAEAESQAALDTGYLVRFHVLDDSSAVSDGVGSNDVTDVTDTIRDEQFNDTGTGLDPRYVFLDAKTGIVLQNDSLRQRIETGDPEKQVGWRGPYLTYHRKLKPDGVTVLTPPWRYGSPIDPWGNPYFLFVGGIQNSSGTPQGGWVNEMDSAILGNNPSPSFTYTGGAFDAQLFDRNTVFSLGPNGLPGDGTVTAILGTGDDLVRAF